jgi:hypothetical protein
MATKRERGYYWVQFAKGKWLLAWNDGTPHQPWRVEHAMLAESTAYGRMSAGWYGDSAFWSIGPRAIITPPDGVVIQPAVDAAPVGRRDIQASEL